MKRLSNLPPGVTDADIERQVADSDEWDEMVEAAREVLHGFRRDHDDSDGMSEYDLLANEYPDLSFEELERLFEEAQ